MRPALDSPAVTGRVALVHDFLLDLRGAERVFAAICDRWPDADVFTAVYDERGTEGRFAHRRVTTSFLQKLHRRLATFRPLLPLYPHASSPSTCGLRHGDLLVERVGARRARRPGRRPRLLLPQPVPLRVVRARRDAREPPSTRPPRTAAAAAPLAPVGLDGRPARRSLRLELRVTAARVRRYLGRESTVLHPAVEVGRFAPGVVGEHYLVLAELMAHKRIDVAVRAFNALGRPLVVVGDGPELRRLRRMAGPTVSFRGRVSDDEVARAAALEPRPGRDGRRRSSGSRPWRRRRPAGP
jgi:hypothetical protein